MASEPLEADGELDMDPPPSSRPDQATCYDSAAMPSPQFPQWVCHCTSVDLAPLGKLSSDLPIYARFSQGLNAARYMGRLVSLQGAGAGLPEPPWLSFTERSGPCDKSAP